MAKALYRVLKVKDGFAVDHDGEATGSYATREAAFEAIIGPASNAIKSGHHLVIDVPAAGTGEANN